MLYDVYEPTEIHFCVVVSVNIEFNFKRCVFSIIQLFFFFVWCVLAGNIVFMPTSLQKVFPFTPVSLTRALEHAQTWQRHCSIFVLAFWNKIFFTLNDCLPKERKHPGWQRHRLTGKETRGQGESEQDIRRISWNGDREGERVKARLLQRAAWYTSEFNFDMRR